MHCSSMHRALPFQLLVGSSLPPCPGSPRVHFSRRRVAFSMSCDPGFLWPFSSYCTFFCWWLSDSIAHLGMPLSYRPHLFAFFGLPPPFSRITYLFLSQGLFVCVGSSIKVCSLWFSPTFFCFLCKRCLSHSPLGSRS